MEKIKELRLKAGLTQQEVCNLFSTPLLKRTLQMWENGERKIKPIIEETIINKLEEIIMKDCKYICKYEDGSKQGFNSILEAIKTQPHKIYNYFETTAILTKNDKYYDYNIMSKSDIETMEEVLKLDCVVNKPRSTYKVYLEDKIRTLKGEPMEIQIIGAFKYSRYRKPNFKREYIDPKISLFDAIKKIENDLLKLQVVQFNIASENGQFLWMLSIDMNKKEDVMYLAYLNNLGDNQ